MKQIRNQQGMTLLSMCMLAGLIGFLAYFGFMLFEPMNDDLAVGTVVENLATDDAAQGASPKKIKSLIQKRLMVNRINLDSKDIAITKEKAGVKVEINYEVRVDFVANVDLIASFSHSTVIPR